MALARRARRRPRGRRDAGAARQRRPRWRRPSPRRCARIAPPPSATCSPAASCCIACSPASRCSTAPTSPRSLIDGSRRSAASTSACPGRRRSRSPSRCARSPTAARRARCDCAIATRAPSSARSPAGAKPAAEDDGGPVALLLDRLRTRRPPAGAARAWPARVQRVTAIESQRTDEIARHLLPDMALSFELLRTLSSARVQGTQIAGNGPVLTLRRVVALIGVDGVRAAANSLRAWPGPLDDEGARALRQTIDRVRLAGHLAQALRPAGYDGEAVYLVAALQSLGRLLVRYHFADEAEQIHQLTQPMPATADRWRDRRAGAARPGRGGRGLRRPRRRHRGARQRGGAPLGARRRGPAHDPAPARSTSPVRKPDDDNELLRIVASAANEIVDALGLPAPKVPAALNQVIAPLRANACVSRRASSTTRSRTPRRRCTATA